MILISSTPVGARLPFLPDSSKTITEPLSAEVLPWAFAQHDVGNMRLVISNFGLWAFGWHEWYDYFTGEAVTQGSEFPKNSLIFHIQSAQFWIGGILGRDTLVSVSFDYDVFLEFELNPAPTPFGGLDTRPRGDPSSSNYQEGVSNQDFIAIYTDTVVRFDYALDYLRHTPHKPLNVKITQKSYAWSHAFAEDFVLFDMQIKNIGDTPIEELYFAVLSRPSVGVLIGENHTFDYGHNSVCGFMDSASSPRGCGIVDTLKMMWGANDDGNPVNGEFVDQLVYDPNDPQEWVKSATDVHGIFFLDYPGRVDGQKIVSYNWWSPYHDPPLDFGPRHREDYRDFTTGGTGTPRGDANRYHVMSNAEIDYDLPFTPLIGVNDPVWLAPPADIAELTNGRGLPGPFNLLSVGPFELPAGYQINLPFAFVCGEDLHTDPNNIVNLPGAIGQYYANLDFSDLLNNCSWARWIYDNPGIDTDGDEYAGEFVECNGDTVYYTGDGVPDWRCASPPPPPDFRLYPTANGIRVRFNGSRSETEKDIFSGKVDFEGYRIYFGRDERVSSMSLIASYDLHNYDKYVWTGSNGGVDYEILDIPYTLDSLRCLYGNGSDPCTDSLFDPLSYTPSSPYVHPDFDDSVFYFRAHDYNASIPGVTTPIRKVYPDEESPSIYHPDSIPAEAYTEDGFLKYYEYEFNVDSLLPTVPYSVNVTAFDFGQPDMGIPGLESSVAIGAVSSYPLAPSDAGAGGNTDVYVYPNPYRIDAGYRSDGYEGRMQDDRPDYRVRALNFANLPARCTIYIYSIDGDLIRRIEHDFDSSDPNSSHDSWNLITRNTQMVVSGLYYWVVEAEDGTTQMGKFVIIM